MNNINFIKLVSINDVKSNKASIVDIFNLSKKQFRLILFYFEKKSILINKNTGFNSRYSVRLNDVEPMMVVKNLDESDDNPSNGILVSNKFGSALEYARLDGQIEV